MLKTGPSGPDTYQNLSYYVYDLAGNIRSIQDRNLASRDQGFTYEEKPTNRLLTAIAGVDTYGNRVMGFDIAASACHLRSGLFEVDVFDYSPMWNR